MKTVVAFLLSVALFVCPEAWAGGVGTVDARLLFVLHPRMARFDYAVGRFYRERDFGHDSGVIQQEMNKAWEKAQPQFQALMKKQSELLQKRYEVTSLHDQTLLELDRQEARGSATVKILDLTSGADSQTPEGETEEERELRIGGQGPASDTEIIRKRMELNDSYLQHLEKIDRQLADTRRELEAAQEAAYSPVYCTTAETELILETIRKDLFHLLSQVAKEQGCETVLDTSFTQPAVSRARDLLAIPAQEDVHDELASRLFHSFTNWDVTSSGEKVPLADGTMVDLQAHIGPRLMKSKMDEFRRYLDFKPYLTTGIARLTPGNIFILGEKDLTQAVARKIFAMYKIPPELANCLESVLTEHRNGAGTGVPTAQPVPGGILATPSSVLPRR